MYVTVEVEVDADDIVESMDDEQLRRAGLQRAAPINRPKAWSDIRDAIRRGDLIRAADMVDVLAREEGVYLPPFQITRAN